MFIIISCLSTLVLILLAITLYFCSKIQHYSNMMSIFCEVRNSSQSSEVARHSWWKKEHYEIICDELISLILQIFEFFVQSLFTYQ